MIYEPGYRCQNSGEAPGYWLLFREDKILTLEDSAQFVLPDEFLQKLNTKLVRAHYLGQLDGCDCYAGELSPDTAAEGFQFSGLRELFSQVQEELFFLAGKAYQILYWDSTHRYCSRCGAKNEDKVDERAKICPACGFITYPRISPAIIVAITREHEILLARGTHYKTNFYSTLAGFVEPGETFEQCVQREVREEVGLELKNIKYFGSQPWPFPDSLMVGFTAEYAGGELRINKDEILDAGWFAVSQLPPIPRSGSISRLLIDWFVSNQI